MLKQIIKVYNLFKIRNVLQKFKIIIKTFRKFNEFFKICQSFQQFKYSLLLRTLVAVLWIKICKGLNKFWKFYWKFWMLLKNFDSSLENYNVYLDKFNEDLNFLLLSILIAGWDVGSSSSFVNFSPIPGGKNSVQGGISPPLKSL